MNIKSEGYYSKELLDKLRDKNNKATKKIDINKISDAIYYIKKYHGPQTRHSGEPYYSHPLEVASIVSDYLFDTETIIAAILHDVLEDTKSSYKQIELLFGTKVADIVDVLTKFTIEHQLSKEEIMYKITSFPDLEKKAFTIKVIDRLHNMRTISNFKSLEKQRRIATETIDFYLSMAHISNLFEIEKELETLAMEVLNKK